MSHELFLTTRHKSKIRDAFANIISIDIKLTLLEEVFAVSRKIGGTREMKFPRKLVFWTIRELNSRKFILNNEYLFIYLTDD